MKQKKQIKPDFCKLALDVIDMEIDAVNSIKKQIDKNFHKACEVLLTCQGKIVVVGMGKSGHIANKIAATFSSTGSPACFMHPSEASHGDIGMVRQTDIVLILSNSGSTPEVIALLSSIKRLEVTCISITGNPDSILANSSDISLSVKVDKEACPLGLAPTSSTTATLVLGDALAIALLQAKGFTKDDFAKTHPGGKLGRRLIIRVKDIMKTGDSTPKVLPNTSIKDALLEISTKALGFTGIVDEKNQIQGVFTDGDLRRTFNKGINIDNTTIKEVMTRKYKIIYADTLAVDALQYMKKNKINSSLVINNDKQIVGAITMLQLIESGI